MPHIAVVVNNHTYNLACDDGEEVHLGELARGFDKKVSGLRKEFKSAGETQLILMAGLLIADELAIAREKIQDLEETLAGMKGEYLETELAEKSGRSVDNDEEKLAGLLESAARRMEDIAARLR